MPDTTPGAGSYIRKTIPRKRLKGAHRKYRAAGGVAPLKKWIEQGGYDRHEMGARWLRNKRGQNKR